MEPILEHTLLYDFYGELLTEHQKTVYEDVYFNDLSYSEIAQQLGVSRQGVHDLVKRCNRILQDYEDKLHLVAKFLSVKQQVSRLNDMVAELGKTGEQEMISQIQGLSQQILETM